jgi:hypothetical protein
MAAEVRQMAIDAYDEALAAHGRLGQHHQHMDVA